MENIHSLRDAWTSFLGQFEQFDWYLTLTFREEEVRNESRKTKPSRKLGSEKTLGTNSSITDSTTRKKYFKRFTNLFAGRGDAFIGLEGGGYSTIRERVE